MSVVWWDRHRHHIMNVNQYPATHNANYNSMVLRTSDFPNFIQAKPLFKQFMLWQGLWLSWASWEGHFLFLFWRQKWKVLSLICACPCYLSYLCLGRLTGDKASWQPPPGVLITVWMWDAPQWLCHTFICNRNKVIFYWKFKIQTGFTMICSSEPQLYITT